MAINKMFVKSKKAKDFPFSADKKKQNHRDIVNNKCKLLYQFNYVFPRGTYFKTITQLFALDARKVINITRGERNARGLFKSHEFYNRNKIKLLRDDVNDLNIRTIYDIYHVYLSNPRHFNKKNMRKYKKRKTKFYVTGKNFVFPQKNTKYPALKLKIQENTELRPSIKKILRDSIRIKKKKKVKLLKTISKTSLKKVKLKGYVQKKRNYILKLIKSKAINKRKNARVQRFQGYHRITKYGIYMKLRKRPRRLKSQFERLMIKLRYKLKVPTKLIHFMLNVIFKLNPKTMMRQKYQPLMKTLHKILMLKSNVKKKNCTNLVKSKKNIYISNN